MKRKAALDTAVRQVLAASPHLAHDMPREVSMVGIQQAEARFRYAVSNIRTAFAAVMAPPEHPTSWAY